MPNIKSSKTDVIRSKVAYEKNKADKSAMKTAIKKFEAAVAAGDKAAATEAYKVAVKEVDQDVGILVNEIIKLGGRAFVTADHGNADQMVDPESGEAFTAHTTNPVPFIACDEALIGKTLRQGGRLADIAPTMLHSMKIAVPAEMTGKSLIEE